MSAIQSWQPIVGKCSKCGSVGTCFECRPTIACRFASGDIRIHVGRTPPKTATFALFRITDRTPTFPGMIPELGTTSWGR